MIRLSGKQAKDADRVGGIALMIPWPAELPDPPRLADNEECDTSAHPATLCVAGLR